MKTYTYPIFAKTIYRFANFPITFFLFLYVIITAVESFQKIYFVIPLIVNIIIIYYLNRYYFRSYKVTPFKIEIDNKKISCSDFYLSNKKVDLNWLEITEIKGGIFAGSQTSPIYLISEPQKITIKINHHLKNYNEFLTMVLQNIEQKLYDELLSTMKNYAELKNAALRKEKKEK